ncbi:PadR family transcriptional regulator [Halovenus salina]|uniref:PadR family transcriptional regulator n=1 Tax=Halovenus salina TaxID=1510225 RepID=A0ABD5W113_9EURY|nr:PadR family transcriptional regulator [Halovenus salina]
MSRFLQSGRRRDICVLLADESRQAQALKSRLESKYDVRIDPKSFYGALDALEDAGFVETRTEGIHDVYALTPGGEQRLQDHLAWMLDHVDVKAAPTE